MVRGAGRLPVVLLQLRPARQLPRHRHRVPAGPGPGEPVPLCASGPGPADPLRPGVPGRGHPDRERGDHLLRLRHVPRQRAAYLDHAAHRVPRRRRRHGDDRRGCRADVHPVPPAGRLPARHRRQHRRHRGLLAALVPRRQASRVGARRGAGHAADLRQAGRAAPGRRGRRHRAAALVGVAVVQRHLVTVLPHLGDAGPRGSVLRQRQRDPAPEHHPGPPAAEGLLPAVPGRSREPAEQRPDRRRRYWRRRGQRPAARRQAHRRGGDRSPALPAGQAAEPGPSLPGPPGHRAHQRRPGLPGANAREVRHDPVRAARLADPGGRAVLAPAGELPVHAPGGAGGEGAPEPGRRAVRHVQLLPHALAPRPAGQHGRDRPSGPPRAWTTRVSRCR